MDLREGLASIQHDIWSHWMEYFFSQCAVDETGNCLIPKNKVEQWQRQMRTQYEDLSELEKESDRDQADNILSVLNRKFLSNGLDHHS